MLNGCPAKMHMSSLAWNLLFLFITLSCCESFAGKTFPRTQFSSGSPWPLPESISTTNESQAVDVMLFRFNPTARSCDILEAAFVRYFNVMFHGRPSLKNHGRVGIGRARNPSGDKQLLFRPKAAEIGLASLDVAVRDECEKWPSINMDESCELQL